MRIETMNLPKYQAEAVRLYLEHYGLLEGDEFTMITIPWQNGREQCYAAIFHRGYREKTLVVVYGEHRNTDGIFVDHWYEEGRPVIETITFENKNYDAAYEGRVLYDYGRIDLVVDHVRSLIEAWLQDLPEKS